jgi:hypothetical protein
VEEFAVTRHRLHPTVRAAAVQVLQGLEIDDGHIVALSPEAETLVQAWRGRIRLATGVPRRFCEVVPPPRAACLRLLASLPERDRLRVELDPDAFIAALGRARVFVLPVGELPSGRENPRAAGDVGAKKTAATPCFMFLHAMIWGWGVLNKPGVHAGNCFDLATPEGFALLLHEVFHIYQFYRSPRRMLWGYIRGVVDSLRLAGIPFAHRHIGFEVEAIAFQAQLERVLARPKMLALLHRFHKLR